MDRRDPYRVAVFNMSIERVINTTLRILQHYDGKARGNLAELVQINLDDWTELKPHVIRCWEEARSRLRADAE